MELEVDETADADISVTTPKKKKKKKSLPEDWCSWMDNNNVTYDCMHCSIGLQYNTAQFDTSDDLPMIIWSWIPSAPRAYIMGGSEWV